MPMVEFGNTIVRLWLLFGGQSVGVSSCHRGCVFGVSPVFLDLCRGSNVHVIDITLVGTLARRRWEARACHTKLECLSWAHIGRYTRLLIVASMLYKSSQNVEIVSPRL